CVNRATAATRTSGPTGSPPPRSPATCEPPGGHCTPSSRRTFRPRSADSPGAVMNRFSLLALVLASFGGPAGVAAERPTFLFLFADDQRYDAMGVVQKEQGDKGRFPWFKTPHMDRLATAGVRFRNAFVVNSLCSPSRACFLSGQYSHANGIYNNR